MNNYNENDHEMHYDLTRTKSRKELEKIAVLSIYYSQILGKKNQKNKSKLQYYEIKEKNGNTQVEVLKCVARFVPQHNTQNVLRKKNMKYNTR